MPGTKITLLRRPNEFSQRIKVDPPKGGAAGYEIARLTPKDKVVVGVENNWDKKKILVTISYAGSAWSTPVQINPTAIGTGQWCSEPFVFENPGVGDGHILQVQIRTEGMADLVKKVYVLMSNEATYDGRMIAYGEHDAKTEAMFEKLSNAEKKRLLPYLQLAEDEEDEEETPCELEGAQEN